MAVSTMKAHLDCYLLTEDELATIKSDKPCVKDWHKVVQVVYHDFVPSPKAK
jgi:hypothetical protein